MNRKTTFQRKIFSDNEKEVLSALATISEKGYPEIVTDLITVYSNTDSPAIKEQIIYILNNLKDKNSAEYLVKGLNTFNNNVLKQELLSACWQNGLDYSPYIPLFIDVIAEEDLKNAIEAFTVIENNISLLTEKQTESNKNYLLERKEKGNISNVILFKEVEKLFS